MQHAALLHTLYDFPTQYRYTLSALSALFFALGALGALCCGCVLDKLLSFATARMHYLSRHDRRRVARS